MEREITREIRIEIKASKRYSEEFVRAVEEGVRDILEGRVVPLEELLEKYGVEPKAGKA